MPGLRQALFLSRQKTLFNTLNKSVHRRANRFSGMVSAHCRNGDGILRGTTSPSSKYRTSVQFDLDMTAFSRRCYQIKSAEGDLIYGLLQGGDIAALNIDYLISSANKCNKYNCATKVRSRS